MCKRKNLSATLLAFDLDDFKMVNDTYGHAEGDLVLVTFAELMRVSFRDSDVFARIGGDEFVVLLTNASEQQATEVLDRFRGLVDSKNAEMARDYDIAFSAGIVSAMCGGGVFSASRSR